MSTNEVERFQADLKSNPSLAKQVREGGFGLGAIVDVAKGGGYKFDLAELKAYISERTSGFLSDEELAAVAAAGSTFSVTTTIAYAYTAAAGAVVVIAVGVAT